MVQSVHYFLYSKREFVYRIRVFRMLILSFGLCFGLASAEVLKLTSSNRDVALAEDKVSFVNFYADWCRYSMQLLFKVEYRFVDFRGSLPLFSRLLRKSSQTRSSWCLLALIVTRMAIFVKNSWLTR